MPKRTEKVAKKVATKKPPVKKVAVKKTTTKAKVTRKPPKPRRQKKAELAGGRINLHIKKQLLPPLAGILVAVLVFGFFNSQWLSARIAYYLDSRQPPAVLDAQTIASKIDKNAPPRLKINRINVDAPIIFESRNNEAVFLDDLKHGVVHYPNTANPGQTGNVSIFGHSSGQWWAPGDYKFIFTLLDKVKLGDRIFIDYKGTRYIYKVTATKVVEPNDLAVLNQGSDNKLTLITCTPVGTSDKRLIVTAEQFVPKVGNNVNATTEKATQPPTSTTGKLPGNDSSFWHNLGQLL